MKRAGDVSPQRGMILFVVVALLVVLTAGPHTYLPLMIARGLSPPQSTYTPTPRLTAPPTFTPTVTPTRTPPLPLPRMALSKHLSEPVDGVAIVGEPVRFQVLFHNSGPTTIITLPLVDNFDDGCLRFDRADPVADNVDLGRHLAIWYDLGPLHPEQSLTVNAFFTARTACNAALNRAGVSDAVDENGSYVPDQLSDAILRIIAGGPTATPTASPTGPPAATATRIATATTLLPTSTAPATTTTPTSG